MKPRFRILPLILCVLIFCSCDSRPTINFNVLRTVRDTSTRGDYEQVVELLENKKLNFEAELFLANAYIQTKQLDKAKTILEKMRHKFSALSPEDRVLTMVLEGNLAHKNHDFEKVVQINEEAIKLNIFPEAFKLSSAIAYTKRGEQSKAEQLYQSLSIKSTPALYYDAAVYELITGNEVEAIDYLGRSIWNSRRKGKKMSAIKEQINEDEDLIKFHNDPRLKMLYEIWADGVDMFVFDEKAVLQNKTAKNVDAEFIKTLEQIVKQAHQTEVTKQ